MFPIRDHNPSRRTPYVTWALIALNAVVFLYSQTLEGNPRALNAFYFDWALIPARAGEAWYPLVTSMFLHGGWFHILGNMLFLWIYGDNLEDEMGHLPYLAFYLAAGLAAGAIHIASDPASPIPTVGASGAIAGVMGAYLLLFPKAKIDVIFIFIVFFKIIPISAWIVLMLWFALQLFHGATADVATAGVAYWAHIGGFAAGLVLALPLWLKLGGMKFWERTEGHPPHPETQYARTNIPVVRRK